MKIVGFGDSFIMPGPHAHLYTNLIEEQVKTEEGFEPYD
jgi:hypothetical protein